ncbi:LOW QUALITY PROTEIN: kinetochore-associated protein DSN1 homolog [Melanerpes formicivorus]|uniref:LOW QUALITY PROTEIN: kinetochore-associated protein DSN1 homolog n=1 Tax=Melanerpes formicivorus TaxID=211600 RepID=UPI00358E5BF4
MEEKEEEEEEAAPGPRGASLRPRPPLPVPPQEGEPWRGESCPWPPPPAPACSSCGSPEPALPSSRQEELLQQPQGQKRLPGRQPREEEEEPREEQPREEEPQQEQPREEEPREEQPREEEPREEEPREEEPREEEPREEEPGRKSPGRKSPGRKSPGRKSPGRREQTRCPSPQAWRRSTLEGCRRKSLPPVHQEVTELSKSISKELPEAERLRLLLLASFQFSAQKLEQSLQQCPGFSPEAFRARVQSLTEDFKSYLQKLSQDGTLRGCVEEPEEALDPTLQDSVAQIKEHIARFTTECQAWDQLLQRYQEGAEDICRQLEECRRKEGVAEPEDYLQSSQAEVLRTKPNYQQVLDEQGEVLDFMQLVLDELQQAVKLLQAFCHDSDRFLCGLSEQLAARRLQQLENSPVRKLLGVPPAEEASPGGLSGAGAGVALPGRQ